MGRRQKYLKVRNFQRKANPSCPAACREKVAYHRCSVPGGCPARGHGAAQRLDLLVGPSLWRGGACG